jgi:hypothetical protein
MHKGAEGMNRLAIPMALLAASCIAQAQQTAKLEFEVASIKPSPQPAGGARVVMGCRGGPATKDPSLFVCENINLTSLVGRAPLLEGIPKPARPREAHRGATRTATRFCGAERGWRS